jgi:hypothetical protein
MVKIQRSLLKKWKMKDVKFFIFQGVKQYVKVKKGCPY